MTWLTLVEVQEEMVQKVTHELDQMYIEDGAEGNEEVEYVDLVEVPVLENALENSLDNAIENVLKIRLRKTNSVKQNKTNCIFLWYKINTNQKSCR